MSGRAENYRKFRNRSYAREREPQLRSWLALDTPSKCQNRSYTIENTDSSVSNRVRSKVTSLNDGWEGPKIIENFKTPVTLVKGVCGWMAVSGVLKLIESGMRCQRTSIEDLSRRSEKFSEPQLRSWLVLDKPSKCQNRSFTIESCHSSVSNRVRSKVTSLNDGWEGPKMEENFKTPVTLVVGLGHAVKVSE
ncbi:hypothetical protein U1Q18_044202 [Sarracenia purpurea var. burkii]